jgi:hypothetical protein
MWRSESGQGILEYILLLLIGVAVVLGIIYQFDSAFKVYANNYFGDYLACLLETGELPNLGAQNNQSTCGALFQPFDINNGQTIAAGSGGGSGGGSGSGSGNGGATTTGRGQNEANAGGSSSGTLTRVGGGGGSGPNGSSFNNGSRFTSNFGSNSNGAGGAQKSALYTGSDESSIPGSALSGRGTTVQQRQRVLDESFYVERRTASVETSEARIPVAAKEVGGSVKNERIQVKRKLASRADLAQADEAWTFGTYVRILIIAAIVIILLLLLGGQALQISKGMDS